MSERQDQDTGHEYDGIRELDNALPAWWRSILYGTMAFAAVYFWHYCIGEGPSLIDEYRQEHTAFENAAVERASQRKLPDESALLAAARDSAQVGIGKTVFESKCVACHGPQGQGGIGPNLTDDYWLHGGKLTEIVATVTRGVLDKGMPSWGSMLKDAEIISVVAYVRSLRGTHPPNPKAPQGELAKNTD